MMGGMTIAGLSYPPEGEPQLLDWWRPLLYLARHLHERGHSWVLDIDQFEVRGCVHRSGRGAVTVYGFRPTGREVYVDVHGRTCLWMATPGRPSPGYFRVCDPDAALAEAGALCDAVDVPAPVARRHLTVVR